MESGVRLVAIDFDLTFVRVHTTGRWHNNLTELCNQVRPVFRRLVPALVKAGILVAIVTFSPQEGLIRQVLAETFPELVVDRDIFVKGSTRQQQQQQDEEEEEQIKQPSRNMNM